MDKIKVAVIGYGHLGKWHCDKVQACENAELSFIVEPSLENQKLAQEKFSEVTIVSSVDECIEQIDAGVVVTPTVFHYDINEKLLKAKKHVFCEKPLTSTHDQAYKLSQRLTDDRIFQVGHSERFHQVWESRDLYGKFLDQCHMEINRYAPFKGRATDVDVVQDLMIHDIDLLYYLLGEYPIEVMSRGYRIRTDLWDSVISTFLFESGKTATINVSRNHCLERRDVTLTNKNGVCTIDLMTEGMSIADPHKEDVETKDFERRDHLMVEHKHFYNSIINNSTPVVTFEDGANAVRIVEGVLNSLEQQGEFITL